MLSISQLETKAKIDNLKQRLEYLERDLLLKNINQKTFNKEKALISQELYDLEIQHNTNAFDLAFNDPMKQIDNLLIEGKAIISKKLHFDETWNTQYVSIDGVDYVRERNEDGITWKEWKKV